MRRLVVAAVTVCLCACGSSGPTTQEIQDLITGITASDGSRASQKSGAPPAANAGPTLTVTSSGTVSSGGTDTAALRASSPIQTVYVSVDNASGFYQLQLGSATTTITLTDQLAGMLPSGGYTASYQAQAPNSGSVGAAAKVTNRVVAPPVGNSMSARIDGVAWSATGASAVFANGLFEITGNDGVTSITFIVTNPSVGSFTNTSPGLDTAISLLTGGGTVDYQAYGGSTVGPSFGTFTITFSTISNSHATGTFSFTAPALLGATGTKTVTNGTFDVSY